MSLCLGMLGNRLGTLARRLLWRNTSIFSQKKFPTGCRMMRSWVVNFASPLCLSFFYFSKNSSSQKDFVLFLMLVLSWSGRRSLYRCRDILEANLQSDSDRAANENRPKQVPYQHLGKLLLTRDFFFFFGWRRRNYYECSIRTKLNVDH